MPSHPPSSPALPTFLPPARLECQRVFEELLAAEPRFVVAPGTNPRLGLICFQLAGASEAEAEALLEAINATGGCKQGNRGCMG